MSEIYDIVKIYGRKIGKFIGVEVIAHWPNVGRTSVLAALEKLVDEGSSIRNGNGRSTYYV